MNQFPENPANGTIFEQKSGVFFEYDAALRSWNRIEGSITPPPATAINDGLMSDGDFAKLNRLVVPPPQSTLAAENCDAVFSGGVIGFRSGDEFVNVEGEGELINTGSDCVTEPVNYQMHQHTFFFDFVVDRNTLFDHMVEEGKYVVRSRQGPVGPRGLIGNDGQDMLPFGSDGIKGEDGSNAPVSFVLSDESIDFEIKSKFKKAVVELEIEPAGDNAYYLVAKRANVGNPNACPNRLRLNSDTNSNWLLAIGDLTTDTSFINFNFANGGVEVPEECLICETGLFYIDIEPMVAAIEEEFNLEVRRLKEGFENIVTFWLNIMAGLFDDQKASMCCALEYCESQSRNNSTRQFIEAQRIQAAVSGSTIAIDGTPTAGNKNTTVMAPACEPGGFGTDTDNAIPNNADPIGGSSCIAGLIVVSDPERTVIQYPECPPGFVPREEARLRYGGADPGDGSVLIQSADPRYSKMLHEVRGDDTAVIARVSDQDPINITAYQEILTNGFVHYDMFYATSMDKSIDKGSLGNMALTRTWDIKPQGKRLQFTDSLRPGEYTLYLINRSGLTYGFTLRFASQNVQFMKGSGEGWSDDYIRNSDSDEDGNTYASNTVIRCEQGPDNNNGWWIQIRVLPEKMPPPPYSKKCGSLGPRPTHLDTRLCKEIPKGMRNPLLRENDLDVSYRGVLRNWVTTKCGDFLVPDAVELQLDNAQFNGLGKVVLCRTNLGNYTGGFNTGKHSAQILIEQQNPVELRPTASRMFPSNTSSAYAEQADVTVGNKYKCTLLIWDSEDCDGDVSVFASEIVPATCKDWHLRGTWHISGFGNVGFEAKGLKNDADVVDLNVPLPSSLLLYVSARKNIKHRHRRTTGNLPRGQYIIDIVNCCLQSGSQHTGHVEVEYNENGERKAKRFPAMGTFDEDIHARNAYVGMTLTIDHAGGEVAASLVSPITQVASGEIVIRFTGGNRQPDDVITAIPARQVDGCRLHAGQIRWLEDAWSKEDCDGVTMTIAGQDYIIIRPVQKLNTQCSNRYRSEGLAFAWPTFNGKEFVAIPDAGSVAFKHDDDLQRQVQEIIKSRGCDLVVGDLSKILFVLFPTAL